MRLRLLIISALLLSPLYLAAQTEAPPAAAAPSLPAATYTQAYCSGFITAPPIAPDLTVLGGADDDFHSPVRQFVQGEWIYIDVHNSAKPVVGIEFSVVRPAKELFRTQVYPGQDADIRHAGKPYEDVAQVRITHVSAEGVAAKVTFSCGGIMPGDILIPFQSRSIPSYSATPRLDHFIPKDKDQDYGKYHGRIVGVRNNYTYFGREMVVYLSLGERQGVMPGARYRIYKDLPPYPTGFLHSKREPTETVGEAVVISVQPRSCVAMVVSSYREIVAGDVVEQE